MIMNSMVETIGLRSMSVTENYFLLMRVLSLFLCLRTATQVSLASVVITISRERESISL